MICVTFNQNTFVPSVTYSGIQLISLMQIKQKMHLKKKVINKVFKLSYMVSNPFTWLKFVLGVCKIDVAIWNQFRRCLLN